jgi:hypothetical protein
LGQQQAANSSHPWAAFYGCWAPANGARTLAVTCVLPVEGSRLEVEQLSVVGGNIASAVSLRADGERRAIDAEGCEGWEVAAFSADGALVYARGSATCAESTEQLTSGVLSITPQGQFLQVAAVRVGDQQTLTTQRFALLRWVEVPPVVQDRLAHLAMTADGARTAAARPLHLDVVEDALQFADASVVEAWMAETGTAKSSFRVTRRELERLVAIEAPTSIIDMSVALANPQRFAPRVERVSVGGANGWGTPRQQGWLGNSLHLDTFCDQMQMGMFNWRGNFPLWSMYPGMGLAYYGWFPECAGRGFYSRWAFGGFGPGNWLGRWYGGPFTGGIVPVVVTNEPRRNPGTVNRGSGYTRGANATPSGGSGQTRWSGGSGGTGTVKAGGSSASSSSGSSSESSGGSRSAGSGGSGRTAQPRNP